MSERTEPAFELERGFDPGEVSGTVRLGRFEAHYEELYAEVIEDGVITADERARLERAADALGLDRERIGRLEQALGAAYEVRHRVRVREIVPEVDVPGPASLAPLAPATDPRTLALERRIAQLEARVKDLERELEEARAHVAVEVDLSDVGAPAPARHAAADEDPAELQRRLRRSPRDLDALRALYAAYAARGDDDRRWCVGHALAFLDAASDAERAFVAQHQPASGLIRPQHALSQEAWRRLLFHPDEEVLTGEIFAVIAAPVLLGRVSALRRDKALPALDPERKQDPASSTVQAVRCFAWAAATLGMPPPPLYTDPAYGGLAELVPGLPPASRLGKLALSGREPRELAFVAGRHLSWYREEHFVRCLVPSIPDLEDLFVAALAIGNPGIPLSPDLKRRVAPLARAIEPVLEPLYVDRLRGHFLRFVEEGGRTNLQRWATSADRTACRAGFLLSGDLAAARAMLELEDPVQARERVDDLLVFATSERYALLRKQLGVAIAAA
ncbi:MAG TPA: hypothetical protein VFS00_20225 [Polyangiaceae bacterium]|nr:hypothetical protein [Polyangiaceae bacterium]